MALRRSRAGQGSLAETVPTPRIPGTKRRIAQGIFPCLGDDAADRTCIRPKLGLYSRCLYLVVKVSRSSTVGYAERPEHGVAMYADLPNVADGPHHIPHPGDGQRQRRPLPSGDDLLGRVGTGGQTTSGKRPGRPPWDLPHDPAPRSEGPRKHGIHRHHPGFSRWLASDRCRFPARVLEPMDAATLRRTRRYLRVPRDRGDQTGLPGCRKTHGRRSREDRERGRQENWVRKTGPLSSGPTWTYTGASLGPRAALAWSRP